MEWPPCSTQPSSDRACKHEQPGCAGRSTHAALHAQMRVNERRRREATLLFSRGSVPYPRRGSRRTARQRRLLVAVVLRRIIAGRARGASVHLHISPSRLAAPVHDSGLTGGEIRFTLLSAGRAVRLRARTSPRPSHRGYYEALARHLSARPGHDVLSLPPRRRARMHCRRHVTREVTVCVTGMVFFSKKNVSDAKKKNCPSPPSLREREPRRDRASERESFIRNNLHNEVARLERTGRGW